MSSSNPFAPKSAHAGYSTVGGTAPTYTYTSSSSTGAIKAAPQIMVWNFLSDGGLIPIFQQEEAGSIVCAELDPDSALTVSDSLRLQVLFSAANAAAMTGFVAHIFPISYIRKHNLERHFRFTTK